MLHEHARRAHGWQALAGRLWAVRNAVVGALEQSWGRLGPPPRMGEAWWLARMASGAGRVRPGRARATPHGWSARFSERGAAWGLSQNRNLVARPFKRGGGLGRFSGFGCMARPQLNSNYLLDAIACCLLLMPCSLFLILYYWLT